MPATHHGTITTRNPGARSRVSGSDGVGHVIVKTMTAEEAREPGNHPLIGSSINVQGKVVTLLDFEITYEPGDLAVVAYNYGQSVAPDNPDVINYGDGNILYPGRLPGAVTEFFEVDSSMESVSILRHERYASLTASDRRILAMMIQAGPLDGEGAARRDGLSSDSMAQECANYIESGTVSVLKPKWIWRYRKLNTNWSDTGQIGKISQPYGPAPNVDGNWLFMGVTGNGWEGGALELTATWESSPEGDTWDTNLYGT